MILAPYTAGEVRVIWITHHQRRITELERLIGRKAVEIVLACNRNCYCNTAAPPLFYWLCTTVDVDRTDAFGPKYATFGSPRACSDVSAPQAPYRPGM